MDERAQARGEAVGLGYHYRVTATNATGTATGADQTFTTAPPTPSAYRAAVLATPGLLAYWRLGDVSGSTAIDEAGTSSASYTGGFTLGSAGALVGDPDRSAQLDGVSGEMTASTTALAATGALVRLARRHRDVPGQHERRRVDPRLPERRRTLVPGRRHRLQPGPHDRLRDAGTHTIGLHVVGTDVLTRPSTS